MENSNENHNLCQSCNKRELCKALCPEAELYVSQDERDWGETPTTYVDPDSQELRVFDPVTGADDPMLSPFEKVVLSRLVDGHSRKRIAASLGISREYLKKIIQRLRKKTGQL